MTTEETTDSEPAPTELTGDDRITTTGGGSFRHDIVQTLLEDTGVRVEVTRSFNSEILLSAEIDAGNQHLSIGADLSPQQARELAVVLWAGADAQENES